MSRTTGFFAVAVFLLAQGCALAQPALPAPPSLATALVLRIFGEVAEPAALTLRDADDESPLHMAAFRVSLTPAFTVPQRRLAPVRLAVPSAPTPIAEESPLSFSVANAGSVLTRPSRRVAAEYQPEPQFSSPVASSAFSFPIAQTETAFSLGAQTDGFAPADAATNAQPPVTMRVGNVRLQARFGAASGLSPASAESEEILPAFIAPYTSVSRASLDAAVAVPVAPRVLLGFGYNTERLLGGYQVPGLDAYDARNDVYSGRLTFLIPRFSTSLSLSAEQYRYQDNLLQSDAYNELRESLNLTVKF